MSQTTVNREDFLHCLESVQPGLSTREIIQQSSCFVFSEGKVYTFNDELTCSMPSKLDDSISGAVKADKLLGQLRKWAEEEIKIDIVKSEFLVSGKLRKAGFRMEKLEEGNLLESIQSTLELPKKWRKLPSDFSEAVNIVHRCASQDQSVFCRTCVHIHPQWIEAHDNSQMCRWKLKTGFDNSTLIRRSSIQHIASLAMSEIGETDSWVHFKNDKDLIISVRRYMDPYDDLNAIFDVKGTKVNLPKGLAEAAEKAKEAADENVDMDLIKVRLEPGEWSIRGDGIHSWYKEGPKKVKWDGGRMLFRISPMILGELVKQHEECEIAPGRLKVDREKFVYVVFLDDSPKENGKAEKPKKKPKKIEEDE